MIKRAGVFRAFHQIGSCEIITVFKCACATPPILLSV
eukprot:IDg18530t1